MDITLLDYLGFFVFVSGVVLFGCSFYFRSRKGAAAFTSAEGTLPTWVVGMSIFATFVSSISFLGLPGDAYKGNWNPFVFSLSIPIATWLAAKVFIPLYRGINSVSAYHYLEMRFGYWARCYVAVCYLLTQLVTGFAIEYHVWVGHSDYNILHRYSYTYIYFTWRHCCCGLDRCYTGNYTYCRSCGVCIVTYLYYA